MDTNYLQTLRYKLQRRLKRINTADFEIYHSVIRQTVRFLREITTVEGVLADLERRAPTVDGERRNMQELSACGSEIERMGLTYALLKQAAEDSDDNAEALAGMHFSRSASLPEGTQAFTEQLVEPLFDYIDERLDDQRTILGLLVKYKHYVEWFKREDLLRKFGSDTQRGEKTLARHLYCYLHEQGIEFAIEPASISGRADLVSSQTGPDRLIADVKVFDPKRGEGIPYLYSGFSQIYQYAKDFSDPFGYLVVFKTCQEDLSVNARSQESGIPFVVHNNKTIFVPVIDICEYPKPASKRGQLKSYELVEDDVVRTISSSVE